MNSEANSSTDRPDNSLFGLIWRFRPFYKVISCNQITTILRVVERSKLAFLIQREKTLVALLGALGRPVNPTAFQNLLFLFCTTTQQDSNTTSASATYDFVTFKWCIYSFTSYHDRKRLIARHILDGTIDDWVLTHFGRTLSREFIPHYNFLC